MDNVIFNNDSNELVLPGSTGTDNENTHSDLITEGVEEAITKKEIKSVLLPTDEEVIIPSYLLDMTNVKNITEESLKAIHGLLSPDGDTAIYIRNEPTIALIGKGDEQTLYAILDGIIKQMYNGQCKIYKNKGNGFEPIKENEVDCVRLNL